MDKWNKKNKLNKYRYCQAFIHIIYSSVLLFLTCYKILSGGHPERELTVNSNCFCYFRSNILFDGVVLIRAVAQIIQTASDN